jgi:NhaP-type Na+/H+ or K+/H+ antiporter
MSFTGWMALAGGLLLLMALSTAVIRQLPISSSVIYLVIGIAIGPFGLGWLHIDLGHVSRWMERLTEVAVIVALFTGGLRLRLPLRNPAWAAARRLAGPVMIATIGGVALVTHLAFGLPTWEALLLGAVLAPTDPVLASAVAVNDAEDHDRMRYGLSGEAGLNDGMAFPFVVFALQWREAAAGTWLEEWFLHRLLWAVPAGLLLGFALGRGLGHLAIRLRTRTRETEAPSDFLALALIALSYVFAELVGAWGFLSAFAAGVGLRRAEVEVSHSTPHPARPGRKVTVPDAGDIPLEQPPAEALVGPAPVPAEALEQPAVAAGVMFTETISFGDTVERLLEVMLVVLVGIALSVHWDPLAIPLALVLFLVIRPAATWLFLAGTPTSSSQRWLMGWFGVRGIGSLYYLTYAFSHGVDGDAATRTASLTLSVVALSILAHGMSTQPLLARYERELQAHRDRAGATPRE